MEGRATKSATALWNTSAEDVEDESHGGRRKKASTSAQSLPVPGADGESTPAQPPIQRQRRTSTVFSSGRNSTAGLSTTPLAKQGSSGSIVSGSGSGSGPGAAAPVGTGTGAVQMEGWLLKWTNYVLGHQERYFVLKGNVLSYYRDKEEMKHTCRGTIVLAGAKLTNMDDLNFSISTTTQVIYLKAYDELGAKRWLTALEMAKGISYSFMGLKKEFGESDDEDWDDEDEIEEDDFLPSLKDKLHRLKTQRDVVMRETTVMQSAFTHIDSRVLDQSPRLKQLHKHGAALYTIVTGELLRSCEEYLEEASKATSRFERQLRAEQRKREKLEETVSQLARQHRRLEAKASHLRGHITDVDAVGLVSEVESDDEFYDAENKVWEEEYDEPNEQRPEMDASVVTRDTVTTVARKDKWRPRITYKPDKPISIWGILKNFIGRDLSKIPMPVLLNEPLSMLQRLTEDLEYSQLLDRAAKCETSTERMCYVAAFTMSSYSTTYYRNLKPFNPLLGETFELDLSHDPNFGWKAIAEQVSHHPPIAAMHTENEHWEMLQHFSMTSKFRGKYLSIIPTGVSWVRFKATGEKFTWTKVTTVVNNIIIGKLWIDQYGDMQITNQANGDVCSLKYIPYSYFSSEPQRSVKGVVADRHGREHYHIKGTWDKYMAHYPANKPEREVVTWHVGVLPPDADKMYGFSYFGCILNDPRDIDGSAPTDCRRRPDLRALEDADTDLAEAEKFRLEEKQRAARKHREENRINYGPRWFEPSIDPDTQRPIHLYKGEYWQRRQAQDWTGCLDIY